MRTLPGTTQLRSRAPVFVLGCPRSGTTLLYYMLISSGNFAFYTEESSVFNILAPRFGSLRHRRNRQKMIDTWLRAKMFTRARINPDRITGKLLADCRNPGDFLRLVMEEIAGAQQVERWAETTNDHLFFIPKIKQAIPEALFIHLIRDGRDVALSMEKEAWLRKYPWTPQHGLMVTGLFWGWMANQGRQFATKLGADYLELRYEDLVTRPRETLAVLGEFIEHDLDYDRIRAANVGPLAIPNTSFPDELENSSFHPVGRWRRVLSAEQLARFESWVGRDLESMGYSLATPPDHLSRSFNISARRFLYPKLFDLKQWLKTHTPIMRNREIPARFFEE